MKITKVFCLALFISIYVSSAQAFSYATARISTPVLNSADFSNVFGNKDRRTLKTDKCGQVREMEFIALPGTVFKIIDKSGNIYQVQTDEYPAPVGISLYVDGRFLTLRNELPQARKKALPSKQEIVSQMKSASGTAYVWGGNQRQGIIELFDFYYQGHFTTQVKKRLSLAGLDCSGLLYEATNGWTPRNTSALVRFGDSVSIAGKNAATIATELAPLDLIVWNGHVLIVLDENTIIESRLECGKPGNGGVIISPLIQRLAAIMKTRKAVDQWPVGGKKNDLFVVRRWYPI